VSVEVVGRMVGGRVRRRVRDVWWTWWRFFGIWVAWLAFGIVGDEASIERLYSEERDSDMV